MAKIKHTKTELKAQTDALRRFLRFLPMLQLKKQQLQMEVAAITGRIEQVQERAQAAQAALAPWVSLFGDPALTDEAVVLKRIVTDTGNIAGVNIPLYRGIDVARAPLDLFTTPSWLDEAQDALANLLALHAEEAVLDEQRTRIARELHTTSQRVNLFEKIKIPECRDNIREIRIFLGDEQTAGVARGKIAKRRGVAAAKEEAA